MTNKKINLKRILATAGCGTALVGALFLYKSNEKQNSHSEVLPQDVVRTLAESSKTTLLRDTIDIALVNTDSVYVTLGNYNPDTDIATSFFYRDVNGKDFEKNMSTT